jgi:anti-sigma factor RsiW
MADPCEAIEPLLSAHLDAELDAPTASRVAAHLRTCAGCAAEAESLTAVRSMLRSAPVRRLPDAVRAAVLAQEPGGARLPEPPRELARARVGAALAVAGGLLAGAVFGLGGQPPAGTPTVAVPLDVYVADHFVHTVNRAMAVPVTLELRR